MMWLVVNANGSLSGEYYQQFHYTSPSSADVSSYMCVLGPTFFTVIFHLKFFISLLVFFIFYYILYAL